MDLGVEEIAPDKWGATIDYDSWKHDVSRVRMIFIHWPGTAQTFMGGERESAQALRSYEGYHVNNLGWRGLAYDYAIDLHGRLYRVRGLARSAATGGDLTENGIPNNVESDAILLLTGPGQKMTPEMRKTLETVCKHHVNPREVYGHRESYEFGIGTDTICPGDDNMEWVKFWRAGSPVEEKKEENELVKLSEGAQEWLQEFYEQGQRVEARPTSLWNVLIWLRGIREVFQKGPE